MKAHHLGLAAAASLAVLVPHATSAQSAADFYKSNRLTVIVGYAAGGGYDTYARFFSRHFGRVLPGHPSLVTQNMPGAGGLAQANFIYNKAAKDGTFIGEATPREASQALLHRVAEHNRTLQIETQLNGR